MYAACIWLNTIRIYVWLCLYLFDMFIQYIYIYMYLYIYIYYYIFYYIYLYIFYYIYIHIIIYIYTYASTRIISLDSFTKSPKDFSEILRARRRGSASVKICRAESWGADDAWNPSGFPSVGPKMVGLQGKVPRNGWWLGVGTRVVPWKVMDVMVIS